MKKVDVLIVGMGLAGGMLAATLEKKNKTFAIIDYKTNQSASKVAVGLVNPITGKRLVKSWLIDDLLPKAIQTYNEFEHMFNTQLITHCNIARIIPNNEIFEQWRPNFKQAVIEGFINPVIQQVSYNQHIHSYFLINRCFWLNTEQLLTHLEGYFDKEGIYYNERFDYNKLIIHKEKIQYQSITADKIIFCEGHHATKNPFFSKLPFNLNKGEVAKTKLNINPFPHVLKKNIFLLPPNQLGEIKVGATYNRQFSHENISEKARKYFQQKIQEITGISNALIFEQRAAIRPATVDRRPFIGEHNTKRNVYIFNGFGAKGVSLIPYFSSQFVNALFFDGVLNKEASIRRFD